MINNFIIPPLKNFLHSTQKQFKNSGYEYFKKRANFLKKTLPQLFNKNYRTYKSMDNLGLISWHLAFPKSKIDKDIVFWAICLLFIQDDLMDDKIFKKKYKLAFVKRFKEVFGDNKMKKQKLARNKKIDQLIIFWQKFHKKLFKNIENGKLESMWKSWALELNKAMTEELTKSKFSTLREYLDNGYISIGGPFIWNSILLNYWVSEKEILKFGRLIKIWSELVRLVNDYGTHKNENKRTALNFVNDKSKLVNLITQRIFKLQKELIKSPLEKNIRIALWRSAITLTLFYCHEDKGFEKAITKV